MNLKFFNWKWKTKTREPAAALSCRRRGDDDFKRKKKEFWENTSDRVTRREVTAALSEERKRQQQYEKKDKRAELVSAAASETETQNPPKSPPLNGDQGVEQPSATELKTNCRHEKPTAKPRRKTARNPPKPSGVGCCVCGLQKKETHSLYTWMSGASVCQCVFEDCTSPSLLLLSLLIDLEERRCKYLQRGWWWFEEEEEKGVEAWRRGPSTWDYESEEANIYF